MGKPKHVGKILAAAAVLLLLPVLFVLMLPGLIFDGFSAAFSPADPETPVLNSEAAIIENANTITFTISGILGEGMEDVMERIERDFAASDGDGMEIINPYGANPVYNANLFVSQYCAAKEKEFADISIRIMAAVHAPGKIPPLFLSADRGNTGENRRRSGNRGRYHHIRKVDDLYHLL